MYSLIKKVIKNYRIVFTDFNVTLFVLCHYRPYNHLINYDFLYSISFCLNYLIFVTFNGVYFIDNTSFTRFAQKKEITLTTFHIGNIIIHNLPFLYVNIYLPKNVNFIHSFISCFTNMSWCYFATNRTFDLGYVYIKLAKKDLIKLYILNICSIIYAPLGYNIVKYIS